MSATRREAASTWTNLNEIPFFLAISFINATLKPEGLPSGET